MHPHAATAIVAAAVSAVVAIAVARLAQPSPPQRQPVAIVANHTATDKTIRRLAATTWGDMQQVEIDKLTALLKTTEPKLSVIIFCADDSKCGDLALDMENAFESAKWPVVQERPLADATVGIGTSSPEIARLFRLATDGRIDPKIITANLKDQVALVIGKMPK